MKSNYNELKALVSQMNQLNDEIEFIKFNLDEGPKFSSVEEMKEFILNVENNNFDFLFDDVDFKEDNLERYFVESFNYTKDNIYFFIYTFEKDNKYITYLSIKNLNDDHVINNLCGKENDDKESAHNWFEELKDNIIKNNIDEIIKNLISGAENTINRLKIEKQELASVR